MMTAHIEYMNSLRHNFLVRVSRIPEYVIVLALSCTVGLCAVLPGYIAESGLGSAYQGMPALMQDSEGEYLSQVHEIIEGHYAVSSSAFYEYKQWPAVIPATGEWFYALPSMMFGMTVVNVAMIYKFLLPALLFFLVYRLIRIVSGGSMFWGVVGGLLVVLGFDICSWPWLHTVLVGRFSDIETSVWTRPLNPITGMLALAAYAAALYRIYAEDGRAVFFPGVLLGLMVGYFFSFVYAGIFAVMLIASAVLFRHSRQRALRLAGVLMIGAAVVCLLAWPTVCGLLTHSQIGGLNDPQMQGLFYTHHVLLNKIALFAALLFGLFSAAFAFASGRKIWREPWWQWCAAVLAADMLVYDIQIAIGWTVWPQHFVQYTNVMAMIVAIVAIARTIGMSYPRCTRWLGWGIVLFLALGTAKVIDGAPFMESALYQFQTYRPVLAWLQARDQHGCVVFALQDDDTTTLELNRFLSAYTNCDVYNSYHIYQGVPRNRVLHNVSAWLWLQGVTQPELSLYLNVHFFQIRAYVFQNWAELFCCEDPWVAALESQQQYDTWYAQQSTMIEQNYATFLGGNIHDELARYRLDYIIVDRRSRVRPDLASISWLKKVYEDGSFTIYAFQ